VSGRLVVIGSGETSPTLVKTHRTLLADAMDPLMLDTPFGFQANADDLTEKIGTYFSDSVGTTLTPARWRNRDEPLVDRERTLALLSRSNYVFAGPGSPSYALRQWQDTAVPQALIDLVQRGGTVVMGSAAAVTLGAFAVPVYEIYKVGDPPHWLTGLDLLGALTGLTAAVIPHFDNREGGRHDTRYCYLGATRLADMENQLPPGACVLGVDEHTAVVLDIGTGEVAVHGAGGLTIRAHGIETAIPAGSNVTISHLAGLMAGTSTATVSAGNTPPVSAPDALAPIESADLSLRATTDALRRQFQDDLAAGDADSALAACLELDDAMAAWAADTLQNDDIDHARRALRAMLVDLAQAAKNGLRDEREVLAPVVEVALTARQQARVNKDFAMSDDIRDGLISAGIDVQDTPDGVQWNVAKTT